MTSKILLVYKNYSKSKFAKVISGAIPFGINLLPQDIPEARAGFGSVSPPALWPNISITESICLHEGHLTRQKRHFGRPRLASNLAGGIATGSAGKFFAFQKSEFLVSLSVHITAIRMKCDEG